MLLPSAISSQLPKGLDPHAVSNYISVRGGLTSSFGETYIVLAGPRLYAFSRASVVEDFEVIELASTDPPRYTQIKWDDVLLLTDRAGEKHRVELSSMNKRELLRALSELYEEMSARDALVDVLEQQLEVEPDRERKLQLRCTLGRLYLSQRDDPGKAVALFESILDERPDHRDTVQTLEELLAKSPDQIAIAEVLERAYRFSSRWEQLIEIKKHIIPLASDRVTQRDHALELGELYLLKSTDPRRALRAYGDALRYDPRDDTARDKVEELGDTLGDWASVARIYTEAIRNNPDDAEAAFFLNLKLAEIYEDRLDQLSDAEQIWLAVLKLKPTYVHALERLREIYEQRSSWKDLAIILRALISRHPDPSVKIKRILRHGEVLEHHLERPVDAIRSYQAALKLEPNEERALDGLTRIYSALERWEPYYRVLQKHLAICSDLEGRVDILRRLATLAEEVFEDDEEAIEHWLHLLEEHDDEEAYQRLAQLLIKHQRWMRLVDLFERRVSFTRDSEELFRLMNRLGAVWHTKLNDPHRALAFYRRADELKPDQPHVLKILVTLHDTLDNPEPHAKTIKRLIATGALTPDEAYPLLVTQGGLYAQHLQQPDMAISALQRAVAIRADDLELLSQLQALLVQNRRWEEAIEVLHAKLELQRDDASRIDLLTRLADLYERRMGQHIQASEVLEELISIDPSQQDAWSRLEVIYRLTESWQRLIRLLTRRIDHTPDPERRVELLEQAAHTAAKQAQDADQAFDILLGRLHENWEERSMRLELARFAAETGRWNTLLERYEELIEQLPQHGDALSECLFETINDLEGASRARVRHGLFCDLARWFDRYDQAERALDYYQKAYRIERTEELFQTLRERLREAERYRPLALLIQQAIESGERPAEQMYSLYNELADLQEQQIGNPEEAAQARRHARKYKSRKGLYAFIAVLILLAAAAAAYYAFVLT